jgi:hypothetical protein
LAALGRKVVTLQFTANQVKAHPQAPVWRIAKVQLNIGSGRRRGTASLLLCSLGYWQSLREPRQVVLGTEQISPEKFFRGRMKKHALDRSGASLSDIEGLALTATPSKSPGSAIKPTAGLMKDVISMARRSMAAID